jgi:hypothetical protein
MSAQFSKSTIIAISCLYLFAGLGLLVLGGMVQGNFGYFPPTIALVGSLLILAAGIAYFSRSLISAYVLSAIMAICLVLSALGGLQDKQMSFSATVSIFAAVWIVILLLPVYILRKREANPDSKQELAEKLFSPKQPNTLKKERVSAVNE